MKKSILIISLFSIYSFANFQVINKIDIKKESKKCIKENNKESCLIIGKIKMSKQQKISAYRYLNKGCLLKEYNSCYLLGSSLIKSKLNNHKIKGMELLSTACKEGQIKDACNKIKLQVINNSPQKLQERCDLGDSNSCIEVTKVYFEEKEKGLRKAILALKRGCSLGNKKACKGLDILITNIKNNIKNIKGVTQKEKDEYLKELNVKEFF